MSDCCDTSRDFLDGVAPIWHHEAGPMSRGDRVKGKTSVCSVIQNISWTSSFSHAINNLIICAQVSVPQVPQVWWYHRFVMRFDSRIELLLAIWCVGDLQTVQYKSLFQKEWISLNLSYEYAIANKGMCRLHVCVDRTQQNMLVKVLENV